MHDYVRVFSNEFQVNLRTGLSPHEVELRRRMHGSNEFETAPEDPLWKKYLEQFKDPMILLLLGSAFVSVCMRQFDDAISITVVSTAAVNHRHLAPKTSL